MAHRAFRMPPPGELHLCWNLDKAGKDGRPYVRSLVLPEPYFRRLAGPLADSGLLRVFDSCSGQWQQFDYYGGAIQGLQFQRWCKAQALVLGGTIAIWEDGPRSPSVCFLPPRPGSPAVRAAGPRHAAAPRQQRPQQGRRGQRQQLGGAWAADQGYQRPQPQWELHGRGRVLEAVQWEEQQQQMEEPELESEQWEEEEQEQWSDEEQWEDEEQWSDEEQWGEEEPQPCIYTLVHGHAAQLEALQQAVQAQAARLADIERQLQQERREQWSMERQPGRRPAAAPFQPAALLPVVGTAAAGRGAAPAARRATAAMAPSAPFSLPLGTGPQGGGAQRAGHYGRPGPPYRLPPQPVAAAAAPVQAFVGASQRLPAKRPAVPAAQFAAQRGRPADLYEQRFADDSFEEPVRQGRPVQQLGRQPRQPAPGWQQQQQQQGQQQQQQQPAAEHQRQWLY